MKRSITRWTMAAAAAVLLAVPAPGAAQTGTAKPQTQSPTSTAAAPQVPEAAREHLSKAKAALNEVQVANLNAKARTQLTEIKKRMTALERAAGLNDSASATGQANRNTAATANRGNANWGTEVAAIDKALTTLLGPASTTGATGTTPPPPTGTSGATAAGGATLDETTRTKLTEVRTHITAFATAMAGGKTEATPAPESSAASSTMTSGSSGTAASSGAASPTSSGAATSTATQPPAQQPPAQPQTQTAPTPQVDESAARQHLTEARNTLSAMTQLPAAGQLQGEARTHVSQLITNFNELITTQAEWRASYAKLQANLTALLGPDPEASATGAASGTAGATGTTGAAGTTGATAGTSGTGTVELDPGIREKLVELRRNLNAFEKAAGGSAAAAASTETTPSPATSASAPSTSSAASGAPTSAATEQTGAQTAPSGNADLVKHVAAIDALLKMQDDSGGLTLTKVQVEQLRTHWAALRAALEKR